MGNSSSAGRLRRARRDEQIGRASGDGYGSGHAHDDGGSNERHEQSGDNVSEHVDWHRNHGDGDRRHANGYWYVYGNEHRPGYPLQHSALYHGSNYRPRYMQSNGHFVVNISQPRHTFMTMNPAPLPAPIIPLPEAAETPKANTIVNNVNLKKTTLRLDKDEENPGCYLVAFSFDATLSGRICIFFLAKEALDCSLKAIKPELYAPMWIPFEKGMRQNFRQAPGSGINLSLFAESDLVSEAPGGVFPLVIRTETVPNNPPPDACASMCEGMELPLPKWVHAQTTHAVLEKKDDSYVVKVLKQIIFVEGIRYELQEIYGIENAGSSVGMDEIEAGKECVICLSELRDTTVLPCRHMCMCSTCARLLRLQSNRCPICRTPVERLLEIKVKGDQMSQE